MALIVRTTVLRAVRAQHDASAASRLHFAQIAVVEDDDATIVAVVRAAAAHCGQTVTLS